VRWQIHSVSLNAQFSCELNYLSTLKADNKRYTGHSSAPCLMVNTCSWQALG